MIPTVFNLRNLVKLIKDQVSFNQRILLVVIVYLSTARIWVSAQYVGIGYCPRVFGMTDFDISQYEGKWYEVEKYWFLFEATSACISVEYINKADGTFAVDIQQYEKLTGRKWVNPGITKYRSHDGSADFVLDLLITQSPVPFRFKYPYLVVDTDYNSYTIKYHCQQLGLINMQTMWILSRNRTLTEDARKTVYKKLRSLGLDTGRLTLTDQGICPP